jgi:hypothetical protein
MSEQFDFDEVERRSKQAFAEAFLEARLGLPGHATVLNTPKWGPIEGTRDGDVITFKLPDHREFEMRLLSDGAAELTLFGRVVGRLGPVTVEPDDEDDESSSS